MNELEIKLAKANHKEREVYPKLVQELINEKYSIYRELAVQRQRETKPQEFEEYNTYCEQCKARAKQMLGI